MDQGVARAGDAAKARECIDIDGQRPFLREQEIDAVELHAKCLTDSEREFFPGGG